MSVKIWLIHNRADKGAEEHERKINSGIWDRELLVQKLEVVVCFGDSFAKVNEKSKKLEC